MPDELNSELDQYKEDSEITVQNLVLRSIIQGVPFVGSSIMEIFNGLAQRRQQDRLNDFFDAVKNRLHDLGEEKIDREFFKSEEFQTLLFLILEKLHTTHDRAKLKMFGTALGNAGTDEFGDDNKELFVRSLRDLAPADIAVLNHESLEGWTPHTHIIDYGIEVLGSLSRLEALGLVAQHIRIKLADIESGAQTTLGQIKPIRTFSLTPFGDRFLKFITAGQLD